MNIDINTSRQLIGTTSWLVPGTYYENARLVAQAIDFVELLIYSWDDEIIRLVDSEIEKLSFLTDKFNLIYTIHLPTNDIQSALDAYKYFSKSKIKIANYVLHPLDGIERLLSIDDGFISVENLKEKLISYKKMTFDIGHHTLGINFPQDLIPNVNEIHMMGVLNGEDHIELNEATMQELLRIFHNRIDDVRFICIEVFDMEQMLNSIKLFNQFMEKRRLIR